MATIKRIGLVRLNPTTFPLKETVKFTLLYLATRTLRFLRMVSS
jgi:hypothetical protein